MTLRFANKAMQATPNGAPDGRRYVVNKSINKILP